MDLDGDGHLTAKEIATHYGFSWDGDAATEMTDEQILQTLQMHDAMAGKTTAPVAESPEVAKPAGARDTTLINLSNKKALPADQLETIVLLDEALTLSDLDGHKDKLDVKNLLATMMEKNIPIRYIDDKGEGPLHKLARVKYSNLTLFKEIFKDMTDLMKKQAETLKRKLVSDVNLQDKQGKTPLHFAVEHKNGKMIDLLFGLSENGPDSLLVNSVGWTIVHVGTNANDVDVLKTLFKHLSNERKKVLLKTKDKTGRTPLHIASFKDEEGTGCPVINFLVGHGARNDVKDASGNVPSQLAERSGRRTSKEVIEVKTGQMPADKEGPRERRRSRDSKEAYAPVPESA